MYYRLDRHHGFCEVVLCHSTRLWESHTSKCSILRQWLVSFYFRRKKPSMEKENANGVVLTTRRRVLDSVTLWGSHVHAILFERHRTFSSAP